MLKHSIILVLDRSNLHQNIYQTFSKSLITWKHNGTEKLRNMKCEKLNGNSMKPELQQISTPCQLHRKRLLNVRGEMGDHVLP